MIISNADDVTEAVLAQAERAPDERFRQILRSAVRHLHGFVREAQLTEAEFQELCGWIVRAGQATTASHNEVVLAAGSLGISSLVCLLNNSGVGGSGMTTANLLGPFWRQGAPRMNNGESLVRSPTPGDPIFVTAWVHDRQGRPVAGARVDVWHSSSEGFYENQDPGQADMNLRGTFETNEEGRISFRSVKPVGYPIPVSGPVGNLLRAQRRHNMRPAHIHFLIDKPGYKTQFSQVYCDDDPYLDSDVQFGVTQALVGHCVRHEERPAFAPDIEAAWYSLEHRFVIDAGKAMLPKPPISGKATGPRPAQEILSGR